MKKTYWLVVGAVAAAVAVWAANDSDDALPILAKAVPSAQASTEHRYAQIPLAFERNVGQTDAEVLFLARGAGYGLFLTGTEAVLSLPAGPAANGPQAGQPTIVRMSLRGANAEPVVEGAGLQQGKSHYYYGATPNQWQRDVERYDRVRYRGVYPGIDLVYYGNQQQLEYDFIVSPGTDPGRIDLAFDGIEAMRLDRAGNLVLETGSGELLQHKPVVYQQINGRRQPVAGSYRLLGGNRVGFQVAAYDASRPLVIDPVLGYSSYLGGSAEDGIAALATDGAGSLYAVGATASANFPLKGAFQPANGGNGDVFIAKFNADGNALHYSTFMGGGNVDSGTGIAVDRNGNAYVTGHTKSTTFPVLRALDPTHAADGGLEDTFVARLNANGTLSFSTYLGGGGADLASAIGLDPAGNVYVAGSTESTNFPRVASLDASLGGTRDGFLAKLTASGNQLVFSTYLGGAGTDHVNGMAIDTSQARAGAVYLTGETGSSDFPVTAPTQPALAGGLDAFVAVLAPRTTAPYVALRFATYLGSTSADAGEAIDVDSDGNAVVAGWTQATKAAPFPVANAAQGETAGASDGFVAKFALTSTPTVVFSTYLGGSGDDRLEGVAIDAYGTAYVSGTTRSTNLIGTSSLFGLQHTSGGGDDAMAARYGDDGERFWVSYLGGSGNERGAALALYGSGSIFFAGTTTSTNFQTLLPFKSTNSGAGDAFLVRMGIRSLRTTVRNFDGDKTDELFWRNSSTRANLVWRSADGTKVTNLTTAPANLKLSGTGDFDGDARADILWRDTSTGDNVVWWGGVSANTVKLVRIPDQQWQVAGIGDFNLDGRSDILWRHNQTGENAAWLSGNHATRRAIARVADVRWKVAGLGDFDGDYASDILWRHSATGANELWLSGDSSTQLAVGSMNPAWKVAGIGDFKGDAQSDVLWYNPSSGQSVVWLSADAARQSPQPAMNLQFAIAAVGDYTGDGRSDIVWRNQTSGANVLWRSGSAGNAKALTALTDQAWKVVP